MNKLIDRNLEFEEEGISLKELLSYGYTYRYLIGILVITSLLLGSIKVYLTESVYRASATIFIDSQKPSISLDDANYLPVSNMSTIISTAIERIKGNGITDSVLVKTKAFVIIKDLKNYDKISYLTATPPQTTHVFKFIPSLGANHDSDYLVLDDDDKVIGKGYFKKMYISDIYTITIDSLIPDDKIEMVLYPVNKSRGRLLSNLKVSNVRNTNIINISFTSTSPSFAQNVVNNYINVYSQINLLAKREKATVLKEFLEKQFENISTQLEDSENNYKDFKLSTGVVAINAQTNQYIDLLRFLEVKRIEYEIKIQETLTSRKNSAEILKGDPELQTYTKYSSSPFFQENTILSGLYSKIAELQVDNARLNSEFNTSHPLVVKNNAELNSARKQLADAISATVDDATKGIDPLFRPVLESYMQSQINLNVSENVLKQIKNEIKNIGTMMDELPLAEVDQTKLQRKMKISEQIYNLLLTNLEEARIMEAKTISDVKVMDWAEIPRVPFSPNKKKIILFAFILGIFASSIVIFCSEHFRTSFPTVNSIEHKLGIPVISLVPFFSKKNSNKGGKIFVNRQKSLEEIISDRNYNDNHVQPFEVFNTLRMFLLSSDNYENEKILVVSSAIPKEGKSVIASNLAITMAYSGIKVLLIDCDFRKPSLHNVFKFDNSIGIVDIVNDNNLKGSVNKTSYNNLFFLSAGNVKKIVVSELINNDKLISTIKNLHNHFDYIIIDTPPINLYTDSVVISSHFKNVLFVMKYNTNSNIVTQSSKFITNLNANIIGIVVNSIKETRFDGFYKYGYGYGYGYGYDYGHALKK